MVAICKRCQSAFRAPFKHKSPKLDGEFHCAPAPAHPTHKNGHKMPKLLQKVGSASTLFSLI